MTASDGAVSDKSSELTYRISPSQPPSQAVLKATAKVTDSSVIGSTDSDDDEDGLDPLYEAIDPEVLDSLFQPTPHEEERSERRISFEYEGCEVAVHSHGVVKVQQKQETGTTIDTDDYG